MLPVLRKSPDTPSVAPRHTNESNFKTAYKTPSRNVSPVNIEKIARSNNGVGNLCSSTRSHNKNIELKYYGNILGDDEAIKRPNSYDRMESHVIARHADF
jgi:hypothetical protein